ncbi:MAG: hypothetical protein GF372_06200 [Candidatus Marinimicrobia bacterium]|nr:hypothetical protein [Candidatus Neomarinimicrobiota bacterium]
MITDHDNKSRRCPMLGHPVQFSYCREPGQEIPCRKIFDCWWETFDIQSYMDTHYDEEIIAKITEPPKPKMSSLAELIQQAQERTADS